MQQFLIYTVTGLSSAGIYAISASGLTLKHATTGVFDWSHGATGMVAAFVFWQLRFDWGWPAPIALLLCLGLLAPVMGAVFFAIAMRRLRGVSETTQLVATLAVALVLVALAQAVWKPEEFRTSRPILAGTVFEVWGVRVSANDLVVLALAVAVAAGLRLLMYRTRIGITMRAAVDDADLAALDGADPDSATVAAWMVGSMLAVLAGILVAPTLALSAIPLTLLIVNGYAAAVIGRLTSVPWTCAGAVVLGLCTAYFVGYQADIGTGRQYLQGATAAIPAAVLFVALLTLPRPAVRHHQMAAVSEAAPAPTWRGYALLCVAALVLALVLPGVLSRGQMFVSTGMWGLAIVALSLVPLAGWAGRLSLCQLSFAAIGAVIVARTGANPLGLVAAGTGAAVFGALVALPALRLRGIFLALSTAAFAITLDTWVLNLPAFDVPGGSLWIWQGGSLTFDRFGVGGFVLDSSRSIFVFGAVLFCGAAAGVTALRRSSLGLQLLAIKDSEAAFATLGLNRQRTLLLVFSLSAAIAGIGGGLYASALQSAPPSRFSFFTGLSLLLTMAVVGIRTPAAAIVVGLYLGTPLFTDLVPQVATLSMLVVGSLAVSLGNHPDGLLPMIASWWSSLNIASRRAEGPVHVPTGMRVAPEVLVEHGCEPDDVAALDRHLGLAAALDPGSHRARSR